MKVVEDLYQRAMEKLQADERPQLQLNELEKTTLSNLKTEDLQEEMLLKVLCVLQHTLEDDVAFQPLLFNLFELQEKYEADLLVHAIYASHRHIVGANQKLGQRPPFDFVKILQGLLKNKNLEVVEWTLRTVAILGGQGIFLKEDIRNLPNYRFKKMMSERHKTLSLLREELLIQFSPSPRS